jgi:hypothetical protein
MNIYCYYTSQDLYSKLRGLLNFKAVTSVIHYKVLLHSNSILIYTLLFPCIPLDTTANIKKFAHDIRAVGPWTSNLRRAYDANTIPEGEKLPSVRFFFLLDVFYNSI